MKKFLICIVLLNLLSVAGAQTLHSIKADSITVEASTRYSPASVFRRLITGSNYRKEWKTPVKMPVFDLEKLGFKIYKMGGGQQTKSLSLLDRQGREWVLRTVDKYVEGALPSTLKNTIAEKITQDLVSAAHPYAAVVVGSLAKALHISAPQPILYFVPDSESLGPYRADLANSVCFLEQREPTKNRQDASDTEEVLKKTSTQQGQYVLQEEVLKARLLDMLVADWDRHPGQWLWGRQDSADATWYYPIPRDRDQAFFKSGGLLPGFAKFMALQHLNWFKKNPRGIRKLSAKSWLFDQHFLNSLDAAQWQKATSEMKRLLTDAVIDEAVKKLPPEIWAINGSRIASTLKSRRDGLNEEVMKYYQFLAQTVLVRGTAKKEWFRVRGEGDNLMVSLHELRPDGKMGRTVYERVIKPEETRQLILEGAEGDDRFTIEESARARIKLKVYGDQGRDSYDIGPDTRTMVYDSKEDYRPASRHRN